MDGQALIFILEEDAPQLYGYWPVELLPLCLSSALLDNENYS